MSLQFWKPGSSAPGSSLDRATNLEENIIPSAPAVSAGLSIQSHRERLPIYKHRPSFTTSPHVRLLTHLPLA